MAKELNKEIFTDTKYYGWIYMILNKVNGKIYVGQTSRYYEIRWKEHRKELNGGYHDNKHLQYSWNKYGEENFEFILLHELEFDNEKERKYKLNEIEIFYIYEWNLLNRDLGYNISEGGSNGNPLAGKSEEEIREIRNKQSKAHIGKYDGENNPFFGKCHSEETKEKMSKLKKELYANIENHPMYGTHLNKETKKKIGENIANWWANATEEQINERARKFNESMSGENNPNYGVGTKIAKINKKTNEVIKIYDCIADANEEMTGNRRISNIKESIRKRCLAFDYKWRYIDEEGNVMFFENDEPILDRKIAMIDKETNEIIMIFNTIVEANLYLGKNKNNGNISRAINNNKTAYGYKWEYIYE